MLNASTLFLPPFKKKISLFLRLRSFFVLSWVFSPIFMFIFTTLLFSAGAAAVDVGWVLASVLSTGSRRHADDSSAFFLFLVFLQRKRGERGEGGFGWPTRHMRPSLAASRYRCIVIFLHAFTSPPTTRRKRTHYLYKRRRREDDLKSLMEKGPNRKLESVHGYKSKHTKSSKNARCEKSQGRERREKRMPYACS